MKNQYDYVHLNGSEKLYGEKNLLGSQLEILNVLRSFQIFSLLRKEELLLKVALKTKISELHYLIDVFEKTFPKSSFKMEDSGKKKGGVKKSKEDLELQAEIESVRRKIEELGRGVVQ